MYLKAVKLCLMNQWLTLTCLTVFMLNFKIVKRQNKELQVSNWSSRGWDLHMARPHWKPVAGSHIALKLMSFQINEFSGCRGRSRLQFPRWLFNVSTTRSCVNQHHSSVSLQLLGWKTFLKILDPACFRLPAVILFAWSFGMSLTFSGLFQCGCRFSLQNCKVPRLLQGHHRGQRCKCLQHTC